MIRPDVTAFLEMATWKRDPFLAAPQERRR